MQLRGLGRGRRLWGGQRGRVDRDRGAALLRRRCTLPLPWRCSFRRRHRFWGHARHAFFRVENHRRLYRFSTFSFSTAPWRFGGSWHICRLPSGLPSRAALRRRCKIHFVVIVILRLDLRRRSSIFIIRVINNNPLLSCSSTRRARRGYRSHGEQVVELELWRFHCRGTFRVYFRTLVSPISALVPAAKTSILIEVQSSTVCPHGYRHCDFAK